MHLRMTGRLHWQPPASRRGASASCGPASHLDDGSTLDLRRHAPLRAGRGWSPADPRRARGLLARAGRRRAAHAAVHRAGARRACWRAGAGRSRPCCSNQALVAGLGNMYVDEALFQARIHPLRPAGTLDPDEVRAPAPRDPRPAGRGRRAGGASIDSYRDSLGETGRCRTCCGCTCTQGEPCPRCGTTIVQDPRRPARHLLVPHLPAGAGPVVTDVPGVRVGHWTDAEAGTGCTVVLPPAGHRGRGGGARRRAGDPRRPSCSARSPSVAEVTALLLTGGSAFGLDAASGVVRWCEERGLGHDTGRRACRSCPRPASTTWASRGNAPPAGRRRRLRGLRGRRAGAPTRSAASAPGPARRWASCWRRRGGARAAWARRRGALHDGAIVAALAVVNAWGDVLDERGEVIAGALGPDRGFVRASERVIDSPPAHPRLTAPARHHARLRRHRRPAHQGGGRGRGAHGPRRDGPRGVAGAHARSTATWPSAWPPGRGPTTRLRLRGGAPRRRSRTRSGTLCAARRQVRGVVPPGRSRARMPAVASPRHARPHRPDRQLRHRAGRLVRALRGVPADDPRERLHPGAERGDHALRRLPGRAAARPAVLDRGRRASRAT